MLRRLRAEAAAEQPFDTVDIRDKVRDCGERGFATGPVGFQAGLETCSTLLPVDMGEGPLAISLVYAPSETNTPASLVPILQRAVQARLQGVEKPVVDLDAYRTRSEDAAWGGRSSSAEDRRLGESRAGGRPVRQTAPAQLILAQPNEGRRSAALRGPSAKT